MIAIDEIHVRESRRTEEDGVARGASDEGVRGGIADARIGFDFDDTRSEKFAALAADENFPEQIRSDEAGVAVVEGAREGFHFMDAYPGLRPWAKFCRSSGAGSVS